MRVLRTATVAVGLALWIVLALAPVVSACMGEDCTPEPGVRSAHCGSAGQAMLCCDQGASQPLDVTISSQRHAALAAVLDRPQAAQPSMATDDLSSTVAMAGHGPPLYSLFASLLI